GYFNATDKANVLFGLFAVISGFYYLSSSTPWVTSPYTLLLAVGMFVLFPWYFAYEAKYVKKSLLWIITACGVGYYITRVWVTPEVEAILPYFFSYTAYILISIYGIVCIKRILQRDDLPGWPFVLVMSYFIFFVSEEMAYDIFGAVLPWRQVLSISYLDLFPIFIIGLKLTLLVYDQLSKYKLEESLELYKSNIDLIFNQSKKFVFSINKSGLILFANPHFIDFFGPVESLIKTDFTRFLEDGNKEDFLASLFGGKSHTGNIINEVKTPKGQIYVAWSFVKLKGYKPSLPKNYVTLFGLDITQQIHNEKSLQLAYNQLEILKNKIQAENIQLRKESSVPLAQRTLIGESPNFNYVLNRIEDVSTLNVPVLLEGETGVGKELFANAIHDKSARKENTFIKVNCAAIPAELMESELFGYEKGAFTGADKRKKGMFELADRGTLFLDEIGDLPISLQPKLLRALQDGEIQLLGAEKVRKVDVRIIAATNRSLEEEVEKGSFRSDLYYRINVFPITIPPLRQRKADIPLLVKAFVNSFNTQYHKEVNQVSESLMDDLLNYSWPGNVRQLRNVIERAVITSSESRLRLADSLPLTPEGTAFDGHNSHSKIANQALTLEECERRHITNILEQCNWKISGKSSASEILDLPSSTLRSKMKKLGIKAQKKTY
ncbi:MAG: sigma 54-interacting transcriptional regulator, partial [Eudoraea sp.]